MTNTSPKKVVYECKDPLPKPAKDVKTQLRRLANKGKRVKTLAAFKRVGYDATVVTKVCEQLKEEGALSSGPNFFEPASLRLSKCCAEVRRMVRKQPMREKLILKVLGQRYSNDTIKLAISAMLQDPDICARPVVDEFYVEDYTIEDQGVKCQLNLVKVKGKGYGVVGEAYLGRPLYQPKVVDRKQPKPKKAVKQDMSSAHLVF